jgi:hypothetical protein
VNESHGCIEGRMKRRTRRWCPGRRRGSTVGEILCVLQFLVQEGWGGEWGKG